jgi:hypothetical protein
MSKDSQYVVTVPGRTTLRPGPQGAVLMLDADRTGGQSDDKGPPRSSHQCKPRKGARQHDRAGAAMAEARTCVIFSVYREEVRALHRGVAAGHRGLWPGQAHGDRGVGPAGSPPARRRCSRCWPVATRPGTSPRRWWSRRRRRPTTSSTSTPSSAYQAAPPRRSTPPGTAWWAPSSPLTRLNS